MSTCTVIVLAYNLESMILECLESIEMQDTSYDISVVVHDDCSSDRTLKLIQDFSITSRFAYKIVAPEENRYKNGMGFFYELMAGCTSKYVAILDGDDVWTDSSKLDRQILQLEENPEMPLSSHVFSIVNSDMSEVLGTWPNQEFRSPSSSYKELASENFIGALTVVFRRDCLPLEIQGYEKLGTGDYGLWGLIAGKRKIGFIERDMANYRQHDNQVYANRNNSRKAAANLESKLFVANHSVGEVRQTWIEALSKDILGNNPKLIEQLRNRIEILDHELHNRSNVIETIYDSFSWRITRPIRRIAKLLKNLRNR